MAQQVDWNDFGDEFSKIPPEQLIQLGFVRTSLDRAEEMLKSGKCDCNFAKAGACASVESTLKNALEIVGRLKNAYSLRALTNEQQVISEQSL